MLDFLSEHQVDGMRVFQHEVVVPHVGKLPLGALLHAPFRHRLIIVVAGIACAHSPKAALLFGIILKTKLGAEGHTFYDVPFDGTHRIERLVYSLLIVLLRFFYRIEAGHFIQLVGVKIGIILGKRHIFVQTGGRSFAQSRQQADSFRARTVHLFMQQAGAVLKCQEFVRLEVEGGIQIVLFQSVAHHHARLILMDER